MPCYRVHDTLVCDVTQSESASEAGKATGDQFQFTVVAADFDYNAMVALDADAPAGSDLAALSYEGGAAVAVQDAGEDLLIVNNGDGSDFF